MINSKNIGEMMNLIKSAYGDKSFSEEPEKIKNVVNLWTVMFQDDEPLEVLIAVKNCIATLQYPPRIADIKSRIATNRLNGQMTEMEAWVKIRKAVEKSNDGSSANIAFSELPKILQKVIVEPSTLRAWRGVSSDTFEGVIASNVQRSYRELAKQEAMYNALPKDIQNAQSWMNKESEVEMLPEPKKQPSIDEMFDAMDRRAVEYRENHGITAKPEYANRVSAFLEPLTENEIKMHEAKEKADLKARLERMHV